MPKVLAQAGTSLSDVYDVEGSIAGVEELVTRDVGLLHEMGATIFSERFSTAIIRATSGDVAASTAFDDISTPNVDSYFRVMNVAVLSDGVARLANCNVAIRDPLSGREVPLWVWDENVADPALAIRIAENGGAAGAGFTWLNGLTFLPIIGAAAAQPQSTPDITFRGLTNAFGAGVVETIALVTLAFAESRALSSIGLPLPGW